MNPTTSTELAVWLGGKHVADLQNSRGRLSLAYTGEAIDEYGLGALCLSVALPVARTRYQHRQAYPWAEGMLPEGETRTVLEGRFKVRRGDSFGLLAAIGRDCAGAVAFYEPGETPAVPSESHEQMSKEDLEKAISELPSRPLGADADVRVSLGGFQAKLLLTQMEDGTWSRPAQGAPSTHILKPDSAEFPGLVAAEAYVLRAAKLYGLPAAEVELVELSGKDVLIVKRFDRRLNETGSVIRIHQEDASQALSLDPSDPSSKYQHSVGELPNLAALADVLRTHGTNPTGDLFRLLAMTTLNIAVGNTDAHVRNHAYMYAKGGVELAPLYDAAPTWKFAGTKKVALWINDQAMLSAITPDHLVREGVRWGMPESASARVVSHVLDHLGDVLDEAARDIPQLNAVVSAATRQRVETFRRR